MVTMWPGRSPLGSRLISLAGAGAAGDWSTARGTGVDQTGPAPIVPVAIAERGGQDFGDKLKRQKERVLGDRDG